MALAEVKYRTFDDLVNSVKLDLYSWDLEGVINPQQLIKVALRVNYDLGVKISQSKSRVLDVYKGKARLPEDLSVMNYGLVCEDRVTSDIPFHDKTYSEGVLEGLSLAQNFLEPRFVNQSTILTDIVYGQNIINHQLHTMNIVVQVFNSDGTLLNFDVEIIDSESIRIISDSINTISGSKVVVMGAKISTVGTSGTSCPALIDCTADGTPRVYYATPGKRHESKTLVPLKFISAGAGDEAKFRYAFNSYATNPSLSSHYYDAYIKDGFIHVQFDEGVVYVNYQSVMEDDDGNLLVLDNPYTNEYYEYALKQRLFENLYLSGEQVQNHLKLMNENLRVARNVALGFVNTPDFADMKKLWEMNRKAQYHNYYNMFKNYIR